ncbi:hypothetical protein [Ensifer sp. MJa1]|uniref:hypothetical protein n=1 Tax=Ensifer sp. MJa1 TaxID=2919888 RepID=UPI003008E4DB
MHEPDRRYTKHLNREEEALLRGVLNTVCLIARVPNRGTIADSLALHLFQQFSRGIRDEDELCEIGLRRLFAGSA